MMQRCPTTAPRCRLYGLGSTDGAAASLQEGLNLTSFSVHRMNGGEVGGVIAAKATAEIAMRLVKGKLTADDGRSRSGSHPQAGLLHRRQGSRHGDADNENLRLGNLWSGIATLAAIMTKQP
jgi:hypothetical protein